MNSDITINKDFESAESNLLTAVLATYFEDLRGLRNKKAKHILDPDVTATLNHCIEGLVDCAAGEWTAYLCGLISIDHEWFMEQVIACAAGNETTEKKTKSLNKYAFMPRTKRRNSH